MTPTTPLVSQQTTVTAVCNDLAFDAIVESCELAGSYARSASEAAWRGDRRLLAGHLAQLRACVVAAIGAHKTLGPVPEPGTSG